MDDSTLDYNSQDVDRKRVKKKTKKKDRIHALSGPETGGEAEVEEAKTRKRKEKPFDAQENKMHRKKKEKQFLIKEEDGENERENVECLQINSEDVMRKSKKHKKRRKEKLVANEENGENQNEENDTAAVDQLEMIREAEVQESKTPKKKKKKKIQEAEERDTRDEQVLELVTPSDQTDVECTQEHKARRRKRKKGHVQEEENGENQNEENDTAAVDQLEMIKEAEVQESKTPKKKKKKKILEAEDRDTHDDQVLELVTPSDQTDVECTQEHKARRRKRKKGHVQEEENGENQNEENDTAAVDQLEMIKEAEVQESKTPKKKKKKKILEAEDGDTRDEQVLELVTPSDQTDVECTQEHKARRRKRKKGRVQEEDSSISEPTTSCIGETTIGENTDSEVFVSLKKKKKKRITDALQADADSEIQSASKSPGRNEQLQDSLQVMETGSDCEPQLGESPRKRKKKKKKKKKKRHSQHGHDEQPESSYVVTEHDNSQVSASETRPESPGNDPSVNVVEAQLTNGDDDDCTIVPKEELVMSIPVSKKRAHKALIDVRKRDLGLLKEYFPNLSSCSKTTVNNLISCELERVKEAKQRGVTFNRGRFTDEENKLLKENVKSFLELSGIKNEEMLFHSYRYPEEKKIIEEIKKKFKFRLRISEGIPRAVQEICHRGVKLFDFSGTKGRFTDEEVKQLKKNWKIHGNNWIAIGALMGRNNIKVQLKASQLRRKVNKGAWSVEETNLLISAVKEYILSMEEHTTSGNESDIIIQKPKLYKGIPWVQIEEKVKTRNWTQCRTKWTEILFLRMNNGVSMFEGISGVESQMKIIQWLYERGPKESGQVNWEELADHIGNVPPMILQIKYYNLKALHVPHWRKLSFKEIVNYLYTEVVPVFAEKLNANHGRQKKHVEAFEKRDDYSVSEIFFEYTDNEQVGSGKVKRKK